MPSMWQGDILASLPRVPRQKVLSMLIHDLFKAWEACALCSYTGQILQLGLKSCILTLKMTFLSCTSDLSVEPSLKVKSATAMSHATFSDFLNGTVILNDNAEPVSAQIFSCYADGMQVASSAASKSSR